MRWNVWLNMKLYSTKKNNASTIESLQNEANKFEWRDMKWQNLV